MDDQPAPKHVDPATYPAGIRGDLARMFSPRGTIHGRPSLGLALERALTRPGPLALVLYRASHRLWTGGRTTLAEVVWRANLFLTGADIHPGAEIGGGLRITHTSGIVIGQGARVGSNVTILHGVTLGGSAKGWFDGVFEDGYPEIGDGTEIMAGAKVLGPIRVGRGCFVGANAVLARDLADGDAYTPGREVAALRERVRELERRLEALEAASAAGPGGGTAVRAEPGGNSEEPAAPSSRVPGRG
jgi:serine O-acetyltransferase